jgi:hypothetical protein
VKEMEKSNVLRSEEERGLFFNKIEVIWTFPIDFILAGFYDLF